MRLTARAQMNTRENAVDIQLQIWYVQMSDVVVELVGAVYSGHRLAVDYG